jgi:hypothetical protein
MTPIQLLLQIIGIGTGLLEPLITKSTEAETITKAAADLTSIVQAALQAHQAITGQPIDLTQLQPIQPVP